VPISGEVEGMRWLREGDQEPERRVREIFAEARDALNSWRSEGVISSSLLLVSGLVERSGGEVYAAHVRRRLGSVTSRSTELL
jgi:hypothetical protein